MIIDIIYYLPYILFEKSVYGTVLAICLCEGLAPCLLTNNSETEN